MYEEAYFNLLNRLHERTGLDNVTVAGGCGFNSVANGKIYRRTRFKRAYIQSAAGDAGGALGSAVAVWADIEPQAPRFRMEHAYWGPKFSVDEIRGLLATHRERLAQCRIVIHDEEGSLLRETARAIAAGKVVGWFQGRMEWGPRALGNRSMVCDPRRRDIRDLLNRKIKRRESFRPFAPSILRDHAPAWFEENDDVPFMMKVFQIRESKRELIPAVTHVDGSGRLQTVHRESNPRYYDLIDAFRELTGIPLVLNTSFNENEPVVNHPREALECFLRTRMDVVVLETVFIERGPDGAGP